MKETSKSVGRSVSLPESLWVVIDCQPEGRSGYIENTVTSALQAAGKIPGSAEADAIDEALDVLREIGAERFRATLRAAVIAA